MSTLVEKVAIAICDCAVPDDDPREEIYMARAAIEVVLRELERPPTRVLLAALAACPTLTGDEAVSAAKSWTEMLKAFRRHITLEDTHDRE